MTDAVDALAVVVAAAARELFATGELWRAVGVGASGLHALAAEPRPSPAKIDAGLAVGRISAVANFQGDGLLTRTIAIGAAVADVRLARGERAGVTAVYGEALTEARSMRLPCGEVFALSSQAAVARDEGNRERARRLADETDATARRVIPPLDQGDRANPGGPGVAARWELAVTRTHGPPFIASGPDPTYVPPPPEPPCTTRHLSATSRSSPTSTTASRRSPTA